MDFFEIAAPDVLAEAPVPLVDRVAFWSAVRVRHRHQPIMRQVVRQGVSTLLRRRGDVLSASDRSVAQIVRTRMVASRVVRGRSPGAWGTDATVNVPAGTQRIALLLEVERPARRRRVHIDVTEGGRLVAHLKTSLSPGPDAARLVVIFDIAGAEGELWLSSQPTRFVTRDDMEPHSRPARFRLVAWRPAARLLSLLP